LAHGNINIASRAVGKYNASSAWLIFWILEYIFIDSPAEGLFMAATQCLFERQISANKKHIRPTDKKLNFVTQSPHKNTYSSTDEPKHTFPAFSVRLVYILMEDFFPYNKKQRHL
jgi:hypothetical protein